MVVNQLAVEYQEVGQGPTVVFLPGSFATGASWRAIATPLTDQCRIIKTSLSGYGKTAEFRDPESPRMDVQLDILEYVLARVNAPVHLVAHSYGAWVALLLSQRRPESLLSLTLLEPTVFGLLSQCGEQKLGEEINRLVDQYIEAWRGGEQWAVRHIIDFYGGSGTFESYPDLVKLKLVNQTETNIMDWKSGISESISIREIARVEIPTLIVTGTESNAAMKRCNQLLATHIPRSIHQLLDGANHFMLATHACELTTIIKKHIRGSFALANS